MAVDGVRTHIDREIPPRPIFENAELLDALKYGNLHEVLRKLPDGVSLKDVEEYLAKQSRAYQSQIAQQEEIYKQEAAIPEPDLQIFPVHQTGLGLTSEDHELFSEALGARYGGGGVKSMSVGAGAHGSPEREGKLDPQMVKITEETLKEWDVLFKDFEKRMFQDKMMADVQNKMSQTENEVKRLVEMAKRGEIDPEWVLIAAAKVNMTKNGTLFVWKGKEAMKINEEMTRITRELTNSGLDPSSLEYLKKSQMAQSETRGMQTNLQFVMQDLQQIGNNLATTLEWVHSAMTKMDQSRAEIRRKVAATG